MGRPGAKRAPGLFLCPKFAPAARRGEPAAVCRGSGRCIACSGLGEEGLPAAPFPTGTALGGGRGPGVRWPPGAGEGRFPLPGRFSGKALRRAGPLANPPRKRPAPVVPRRRKKSRSRKPPGFFSFPAPQGGGSLPGSGPTGGPGPGRGGPAAPSPGRGWCRWRRGPPTGGRWRPWPTPARRS